MNINSFSDEIKRFYNDHKLLCRLTLGVAVAAFVVGSLAGRLVTWLSHQLFGTTKKTDEIGRQVLQQTANRPAAQSIQAKPAAQANISSIKNEEKFQKTLKETPQFKGYQISLPEGHPCQGVVLTGVKMRPANLFFAKLFEGSTIATTMPGSYQLFAFNTPHKEIRNYCEQKAAENADGAVTFSANGIKTQVKTNGSTIDVADLSEIFGVNAYSIGYQEIIDMLNSQKIYVSSLLPLPFYSGLKEAMAKDKIVVLPGDDGFPALLKDLKAKLHIGQFLAQVEADPALFGFESPDSFKSLLNLTIYQIGSMVVKTEDYHVFTDGDGKILQRKPGQNDAIRLINACGIRGLTSSKTPAEYNKQIMTETFKTSLIAAGEGIAVFPAVGMGVWRGDPELYWSAFLDAVIASNDNIEAICVNPGHQKSASGKYQGNQGQELQMVLDDYRAKYKDDEQALKKLDKIVNLYEMKTDLVQLARHLKLAYPDKIISLFNASDPDVTLGYHVTEYTNNWPHTITTEENYSAMGSNGLCFEGITQVHESPARLIQT